jgi:hypothetical protein
MIAGAGARVHLAPPLGVKAFAYRQVNTDEPDAADRAHLLRMGRLTRSAARTDLSSDPLLWACSSRSYIH